MGDTGQWIACAIAAVVFTLVAVANWQMVWLKYARKSETGSFLPFLGGAAGIAAIFMCPLDAVQSNWWLASLPPILDFGTVPYLLLSVLALARTGTGIKR